MKSPISQQAIFRIILALFVVYGLIFIYSTSFEINGERYFTLFDDGMISMRYARNFAEGYGLVWNPGGPAVEGYTNPLWVILMAFWHLFPIAASKMSLIIQLNALALLTLNLVFVRRLTLAISNSNAVALIAVILTATYLPLNNWSLQGMEVAALAPLVSCAAWLAVKSLQSGKPSPVAYLLLGVGILVRMDVAVLLGALILFLFFADKQNRFLHLGYGIGAFAIFGGAQTLFRLAYYGYLFPNTYYLKLDGFPLISRMLRGAYVFGWFMASMSLVVFLATFVIVALRRNAYVLLLAFLFAAQSAYSIYVGGDAWEWWGGSNRYISIVMPLFMVLLAYSLHYVFTHERWRALVDTAPAVAYVHVAILVGLLLWAVIVNYGGASVGLPEWGIALALWAAIGFALNRRVSKSAAPQSANKSSFLKTYALPVVLFLAVLDLNSLYVPQGVLELFLVKAPIQVHNNPKMVERALLLRQTLKPGATYAVVWAGIIPYFAGGDAIDLLGKNDTLIAHQPMHANAIAGDRPDFYFYPGHMKYDYAYSIGQLKPDVVIQFWSLEAEPPGWPPGSVPSIALPFIDGSYTPTNFGDLDTPFYYRDDSSRVLRDAVEQLAKLPAGQTTP